MDIGQKYGLEYAEEFHYIGPGENTSKVPYARIERYLDENVLPFE